jgi:hypothetical protein
MRVPLTQLAGGQEASYQFVLTQQSLGFNQIFPTTMVLKNPGGIFIFFFSAVGFSVSG